MQWMEGNNDMSHFYNPENGQIYAVIWCNSSCSFRAQSIKDDKIIGEYITRDQAKRAIENFYSSGGR